MSLIGEVFVADVLGKPVLDPAGEEIGRVRDIAVEGGGKLPRAVGLIIERNKAQSFLPWEELNIFNKRIISCRSLCSELPDQQLAADGLLIAKDILDKQIVDINGAKVVRVNDIKLTDEGGSVYLTAVDVGMRGLLRRLGFEKRGDAFFRAIRHPLRHQLIPWTVIQPLESKLDKLTLSVSRDAMSDLHPADIAQIISDLAPDERTEFFEKLDLETAAEALHELEPEVQADIINDMDKEQAADVIERMPPDEAADVIADLSAEKAQEILGLMEHEEAQDVHELLHHEDDTAGGLMTNEFLSYAPEMTVGEIIRRFRQDAVELEAFHYMYALRDEKLLGVISLREAIMEDPEKTLAEAMHTKMITVRADSGHDIVAELISKYNLLALPVVDDDGCLLGVITVDDVVDLLLPPASRKRRRKM